MVAQQREHGLVRQRGDHAALAPLYVLGGPERIQHRLLGRIDDGREKWVRVEAVSLRAARRRQGDEDLAAPVVAHRTRAREAEAGAAREPRQRVGAERGVGCDDDDRAAARAPAPRWRRLEQPPGRDAVDPQLLVGCRSSSARARRRSHHGRRGSPCRFRPSTRSRSSRCRHRRRPPRPPYPPRRGRDRRRRLRPGRSARRSASRRRIRRRPGSRSSRSRPTDQTRQPRPPRRRTPVRPPSSRSDRPASRWNPTRRSESSPSVRRLRSGRRYRLGSAG